MFLYSADFFATIINELNFLSAFFYVMSGHVLIHSIFLVLVCICVHARVNEGVFACVIVTYTHLPMSGL